MSQLFSVQDNSVAVAFSKRNITITGSTPQFLILEEQICSIAKEETLG